MSNFSPYQPHSAHAHKDRLWDVLGKGEEYAIADYAAAHWKKHKRPLRIAVDEACWRFNNLTDEQVARIREGEPAANPNEKVILWRILSLWQLNIQLLFVTDGLQRPGKKRWGKSGGRGGGKVDAEVMKMLHQMFDRLHVPYHRAPGEAEAECARLQQLNVVDAVWSDDGDCLMFGCTTLIKAHRNAAGQKDWNRIQVYRTEMILPPLDFDTDSLVMFAVVAGGDYDDKGLPGCGHQKAKRLVQRNVGLAHGLRRCESKADFTAWRLQFAATLREMAYKMVIPPTFPHLKALDGYRNPAVSEDERCRNLRGLHVKDGGWEWWESQMDQTKLRVVLRSHYNLQTRGFLKHLAPVFLARALTRNVTPDRREENLSHEIVLRRTMNKKGKNGEDLGQPSEINIKFKPEALVQINLSVRPPEEDWSSTVRDDGIPYDPRKHIDGQMLSCFLTHGLPEGALDKTLPSQKKKGKKSQGSDGADGPDPIQSRPVASQQSAPSTTMENGKKSNVESDQSEPKISQAKASKKRKSSAEDIAVSSKPVKRSKITEQEPSCSPPIATFRRLEIPTLVTKKVPSPTSKPTMPPRGKAIDLDDLSGSDQEVVGISSGPKSPPRAHAFHKPQAEPRSSYPSIPETSQAASTTNPQTPSTTLPSSSIPPKNPSDTPPTSRTSATNSRAPPSQTVQLDTPSTAILRQRRERGLLSKLAGYSHEKPVTNPASESKYEVIDLT